MKTDERHSGEDCNTVFPERSESRTLNKVKRSDPTTPSPKEWIADSEKEDIISILDHAPCGIAINEPITRKVLYINQACIDISGYTLADAPTEQEAQERLFSGLDDRECFAERSQDIVSAGSDKGVCRIVCKDGQIKTVDIHSVYLKNKYIASIWTDVTRQVTAETELKNNVAMFQSLFDQSFDAALLVKAGRIVRCNSAAQDMFRCTDKMELLKLELRHLAVSRRTDGSDSSQAAERAMQEAIEKTKHRFEWQLLRRDGHFFPAEITMTAITQQGAELLCVVARDITARKRAEQSLLQANDELEDRLKDRASGLLAANQRLRKEIRTRKKMERELEGSREELRRLSEHIQRAREEERTQIAREVHDRLGQMLSAMKIDINCLGKRMPISHALLVKQTRAMERQIDTAIQSIRDICEELRPPILEDFGLPAAIEWYLETFQKRTGIHCHLNVDPELPEKNLELDLMLFRILQEAMTNIMRHSAASEVTVRLEIKTRSLALRIHDNGKGITRQQITSPRSLGIIGIKERVRFWGGKTSFKGRAGLGTSMSISIPLDGAGVASKGERL